MHTTKILLKDGRALSGIIWSVDIKNGWFTLAGDDVDSKIKMDDCESVVTLGERIRVNEIGDQDMLAKWARDKERFYDKENK